ncbi:uncharacterized protein LOC134232780, partial [Saccostrea cucullata]|uniref:uncharacterized protein LOC134232780 n=1 Tax=Saccostrea cuccullata TaxID=36930 RepID=UPI002ED33CE4
MAKTFGSFGYIVDSCPRNKTEYTTSATRLGCGVDENGRSQYVCVPNHQRSSLVEFCYKSTTGLYEKGNCIEIYESGNLDQTSCHNFTDGCPDNHFFLSDLYRFPQCHRINPLERCFFAEPTCPNVKKHPDKPLENRTLHTGTVAGITIGVVGVILAVVLVIFMLAKRRQKGGKDPSKMEGANEESERLILMKTGKYHEYSEVDKSLLYSLLLCDKYTATVNREAFKSILIKIRKRYFPKMSASDDVDWTSLQREVKKSHNGEATFISDDIRHDVMYAFVTECLVEDSDLEFFLTTASRDVISEYCRSAEYERSEGERCLYIPDRPEKMYDLFINKLQLDIITHCTVCDRGIHGRISERFGVPMEVLYWDHMARERYVEYAKRGTQTVHHARGMIVGCAGAGKTTLLKRLLRCTEEEIKEVKSTEGLEVHEEIFELCDESTTFKARKSQENREKVNTTNVYSKTLTLFDFGGQCAYYACHQIYLTRRAFFVVVVDASKHLDQKVDKKVCDQDGSVFSGWTYGDYFVFWIKSIHTYCGSDNQKDTKPVVLIVATHWEEGIRKFRDKKELIESLCHQFPEKSYLPHYITDENVYCTDVTLPLHDLETCLFNIASNQRWNENIPREWSFFGLEINQKKHSERILKISKITTKVPEITAKGQKGSGNAEKGAQDMLRYYHDAGKALYFNENGLKEEVIIDVQWFIDAFKHIITDKLHSKGIPVAPGDWDEYYKTGNLQDKLLTEIWKHNDEELFKNLKDEELFKKLKEEDENYQIEDGSYEKDKRYLKCHKGTLLNFMQRLGLLGLGTESHYVPCMNRKEIEAKLLDIIEKSKSKSSVLVYQFEFLPFFLFYRLVVACMQEDGWYVQQNHGTSCLYKNAALFSCLETTFLLSVTEESIQLQVFCLIPGSALDRVETCKIQGRIEDMLDDLAGTFHRKI